MSVKVSAEDEAMEDSIQKQFIMQHHTQYQSDYLRMI
jgi:hypothetical protein